MKYLSLNQPHANNVLAGLKTLETRKWSTKHRGDVVICSTKVGKVPGQALCIVKVTDCKPLYMQDAEGWKAACCEPYSPAYGWKLEDLRPITPFPVKGMLGLWEGRDMERNDDGTWFPHRHCSQCGAMNADCDCFPCD